MQCHRQLSKHGEHEGKGHLSLGSSGQSPGRWDGGGGGGVWGDGAGSPEL